MRKLPEQIEPFYVLMWNFNNNKIEYYDVMGPLLREFKRYQKHKKLFIPSPYPYEAIFSFIIDYSQRTWWGRCQYEVIVQSWPSGNGNHKLDIHEQVMMNIHVITKHFIRGLYGDKN